MGAMVAMVNKTRIIMATSNSNRPAMVTKGMVNQLMVIKEDTRHRLINNPKLPNIKVLTEPRMSRLHPHLYGNLRQLLMDRSITTMKEQERLSGKSQLGCRKGLLVFLVKLLYIVYGAICHLGNESGCAFVACMMCVVDFYFVATS